eukprot:CAMPEP_0115843934 /NCGR_PEP_ID=MMETSP0287-20121206/8570_1 /TAXON_ID=412157 /ORGANISM="Chrysochromulina rotalis, Strain UIO044" /LENGTH=89 /DNA_ID=CAMNT_0003297647 /DNA_START=203 /DNA_END=472 /DNA_ORIENTATION=-
MHVHARLAPAIRTDPHAARTRGLVPTARPHAASFLTTYAHQYQKYAASAAALPARGRWVAACSWAERKRPHQMARSSAARPTAPFIGAA